MTKTNKDGWIRHRGGRCPVEAGTLVDVRYRDGKIKYGLPANENAEDESRDAGPAFFRHDGAICDIMAWRPHKPDIEALIQEGIDSAEAGALTPLDDVLLVWKERAECAEGQASESQEGPIQWRDRIRELDEQREEVCALYNRQVAEIKEERASLVAKLKAEGFALIQSDEPNSELESAQDDIAQQDMSDPANWRVGDVIEVIHPEDSGLSIGDKVSIIEMDIGDMDRMPCKLEGASTWLWIENMKWHSRPTN